MPSTSGNTPTGGIHPLAVVDQRAILHPGVTLAPFVFIDGEVEIGAHTAVGAHTVITGPTRIGAHNVIGHHVVLGAPPQIRENPRGQGALIIGDGNIIREFVTMHGGRPGSVTRLGNNNYLMAYSHVAHDCQLGDGIELANAVQLAGHVQVEDHAIIGGLAGLHQFVRVGRHCFVGAGSMVAQDVLPYSLVSGDRARCYGLNTTGLKRRGFLPQTRLELAVALKTILMTPILSEAMTQLLSAGPPLAPVQELLVFIKSTQRGFCGPVRERRRS